LAGMLAGGAEERCRSLSPGDSDRHSKPGIEGAQSPEEAQDGPAAADPAATVVGAVDASALPAGTFGATTLGLGTITGSDGAATPDVAGSPDPTDAGTDPADRVDPGAFVGRQLSDGSTTDAVLIEHDRSR